MKFTQKMFVCKSQAVLEPCATGLPVTGHMGEAIGRPMPGFSWLGTSD